MTSQLRKAVEEVQSELTGEPSGKTVCLEIKLLNPTEEHIDLIEDLILPLSENLLQLTPAEGVVHIYGFVPVETANSIVDYLNEFIGRLNDRLAQQEGGNWLTKYMKDESLHIESISLRPEFYHKDDILAEIQLIKQAAEQYKVDVLALDKKIENMSKLTLDDVLESEILEFQRAVSVECDVPTLKNQIHTALSIAINIMNSCEYLPLDKLNKECKAIEMRYKDSGKLINQEAFSSLHDYAISRLHRSVYNALYKSFLEEWMTPGMTATYHNFANALSNNVVEFLQLKHLSQLKEAIYTEFQKEQGAPWSTRFKELIYQTRADLDNYTSPKLTKTNKAKFNPSL